MDDFPRLPGLGLPPVSSPIVQATALGFAEHYLAETNSEGNSGKRAEILGGVRGEDDEVCVHTFGDATRVRREAEALRRIRGERSKDLLEAHARAKHPCKF